MVTKETKAPHSYSQNLLIKSAEQALAVFIEFSKAFAVLKYNVLPILKAIAESTPWSGTQFVEKLSF